MTMKKLYSCNLCGDEFNPNFLVGMRFAGAKKFEISYARQTDGTHVCFRCMDQIYTQQKQYDAVRVCSEENQQADLKRG